MTEKYKSCEIYRKMFNINGEAGFREKKKITTALKKKKRQFLTWKYWLFNKEKAPITAVNEEDKMLTVFWHMKEPITIGFLEKGVTANNAYNWQLLRQNSPFFIE